MPTAGDTRLGPLALGRATAVPANGAVEIAIDLANMLYTLQVEEWIDVPPMWIIGASQDIVSVAGMVLSINPVHSTDTLTFLIDPGEVGNEYAGRITIPSLADFSGSTEYTWSVNLNITHGTLEFGEVTRNYTTDEASFTVIAPAPTKATNPTPADEATNIPLSTDELSWDDGGGSDTYDVYFGPDGDMTLRSSAQAGTTWELPVEILADYETVYDWRIDATNAEGTTTGDTWSFTTLVFAPPYPTGGNPDGSGGGEYDGEGGKNLMRTVRRLLVAAANKIFYEDE